MNHIAHLTFISKDYKILKRIIYNYIIYIFLQQFYTYHIIYGYFFNFIEFLKSGFPLSRIQQVRQKELSGKTCILHASLGFRDIVLSSVLSYHHNKEMKIYISHELNPQPSLYSQICDIIKFYTKSCKCKNNTNYYYK